MNGLLRIFSTREIATILWTLIFFIFIFRDKSIRISLRKIAATLFNKKLLIPLLFLYIYLATILYLLYTINIWEMYLLKDSIIWGVFSATTLMFKSFDNNKDYKEFITIYFFSSLKLVFIFEFLINFFTFNLLIELILIPLIAILVIFEVVSEKEQKYKQIYTISRYIQCIIGLILIIYVSISVFNDFNSLGSLSVLKSVLFTPFMTILIFPYIYIIKLYTIYELLFLKTLFTQNKDKKFRRKIQLAIITSLKLNLKKSLDALHNNEFNIMNIQNEKDIKNMKEAYSK